MLKKYPEINGQFQKYAIEQMNRQNFPPGLSSVPTVLELETQKLYGSKDAFNWLKNKVTLVGIDLSGTDSNNDADFSFIGDDERDFSSQFSILGQEHNNGTNINADFFDQTTGKQIQQPIQNSKQSRNEQSRNEQFQQMNQRINQQQEQMLNVNNTTQYTSYEDALRSKDVYIQKNPSVFQANVNQTVQQQDVSSQQYQQYNNQYQQFNNNNNNNNNQQTPQLPPMLQPIKVDKGRSQDMYDQQLNSIMAQRDNEFKPMQRM